MKKLKLLPSVLMLVLCLGVLAVGIYAIQPTSNTITGTVTITAANAAVEIDLYKRMLDKDGNLIGAETKINAEPYVVRNATTLDLGRLEFMAASGAKSIAIRFDVRNSSSKRLGMYFAKSASTTVGTFEAPEALSIADGKITASFSNYTDLPAKGSSDDAVITFALNSRGDEDVTIDETAFKNLNIFFNIEDYNVDLEPTVTLIPSSDDIITRGDYEEAGRPSKVLIPNTVIGVESAAFAGDEKLVRVTLGTGLTDMPNFSGCTNLNFVDIPTGFVMEYVDYTVAQKFQNCPNVNFYVGMLNGCFATDEYNNLVSYEDGTIYVGSDETEMNLDNKIIQGGAFVGRTNLQTVSLNGSAIGMSYGSVFEDCTSLSTVKGIISAISDTNPFCNTGLTTMFISGRTGVWNDSNGLNSGITYYTDVASANDVPARWNTNINGGDGYGFCNYADCTINYGWSYERYAKEILGITDYSQPVATLTATTGTELREQGYISAGFPAKAIISDTVLTVYDGGEYDNAVFFECTTLQEITLGAGLTHMPDFTGCTNLTKVVIPAGFTLSSVEGLDQKFIKCPNVKFEVADGNTQFANNAEGYLTSKDGSTIYVNPNDIAEPPVTITGSNGTLTNADYENAGSPARIKIDDSVTEVEYDAFTGNTSLQEVTLGTGLTSMPNFSSCTNLTKVIIPAGLNLEYDGYQLGQYFKSCPNISFEVAESNAVFANDTYGNLTSKDGSAIISGSNESEMILDGKYIDWYAFYGRTNLKIVSLDDSYLTDSGAFEDTTLDLIKGAIRSIGGGSTGFGFYSGPVFISSSFTIWNDGGGMNTNATYYTNVASANDIPASWNANINGGDGYGFNNYADCTINYGWTYERFASEILGIN